MNGSAAPALRFGRHVIEMCLVMCPSAIVLNIAIYTIAAWLFGYTRDPRADIPQVAVGILGIMAAIPMLFWMRFRGHEWRPTLEMAAGPLGVVLVAYEANATGFLALANTFDFVAALICPVMVVAMLFRWDLYSGAGAHAHHAAHMA